MKNFTKLSIALVSFSLIGAGCGAAKSVATAPGAAPTEQAAAPAAAAQTGAEMVSAKLAAAGIAFTMKDKTAAGTALFTGVEDAIAAITEFKITGSGVIVSVVDAKDGRGGIVMAKMSGQFDNVVKVADANYQNSFVRGLGDASVNEIELIFKDADQATVSKVKDALLK